MPQRISDLFKADGAVARAFTAYEERPQQQIMADGVWDALHNGHRLIVEAGTGVGKSFAYLVPAVFYAVEQKIPVVISTKTLNLQDQLLNKDIPILEKALDIEFTARVLKGRSNYLCLRRLKFIAEHKEALESREEKAEFDLIGRWVNQTTEGTKDDLPFRPETRTWSLVCSEGTACRGRKCNDYDNCFYYYAKSRLTNANIIIVNHSLYFSDMVIDSAPGVSRILPEHKHVVFDEAHTIEEVASSHIGIRLSNFQVQYLLRGLYNPENNRGFLTDFGDQETRDACRAASIASDAFFARLADQAVTNTKRNETIWELEPEDDINETLSPFLDELAGQVYQIRKEIDEDDALMQDVAAEFDLRYSRLMELSSGLRSFLDRSNPDWVHWIEFGGGASGRVVSMHSIPLDVSSYLREQLIEKRDALIMTGATLSVAPDTQFKYFRRKTGLDDYKGIKLDSPFDFAGRVRLLLGRSLPQPKDHNFQARAVDSIKKMMPDLKGGVLLLFTSYGSMNSFADELYPPITGMGRKVFVQGQGLGRAALLEEFQEAGNGVLFATSSFWMGVDVPGDALQNVFIMRLPFAVPNHPVIKGKCRRIEERGGNPFMEYSVPEAILTFRQGVGRLLRTGNDQGTIAVFDSRIVHSRYGRYFQLAIPECPVEYF